MWLAAGFAVWCSALVVLYAIHAIGCAFALSAGPLRLGLALALLAHLAVIGWMWRSFDRAGPNLDFGRTGAFLYTTVVWIVVAAFVTTILTLGPALLLAVCT
jgi:hypothetical protein